LRFRVRQPGGFCGTDAFMTVTATEGPTNLSLAHRLRFLARDSALYGGAAAVRKAFALITFPLLARHFSVADYGTIDYFSVVGALLAVLFIFGQDSSVARFFYEYSGERERRQLISQSLVLQLAGLLAMLPVLWMAADQLADWMSASADAERLLKLVLLQVPFLLLINFSQNLLKWTFARTQFLLLSLGSTAANLVLLLFGVLVLRIGVAGVFVVYLVVQAAFGLLGLIMIRRWLVVPSSLTYLRQLVPYAVPFGIIGCIAALVPAIERGVVSELLGAHDLGLYAAGTKVALLMTMLVTAFQTAWGPFSLAIYKEADAGETYNWVVRVFVLGICAAVLSLSAVAQPMIHLLASDRYAGAAVVVFPLAMGLAIQATSWITELGITLSKKSYLGLYSYVVFLMGTFIAIHLLVSTFALAGVALGVLVGHVLKAFTAAWLAQRAHPLPWEYGPMIGVLAATVAIGLAGMWATAMVSGLSGSAVFAVGTLAVMGAGCLVLFDESDRRRIGRSVRQLARRRTR
jgi:O-antigen/teichoic acid export membrane protein